MHSLTYSDKVPTRPGWYWRHGPSGVSVVKLPKMENDRTVWPEYWQTHRNNEIAKWGPLSKQRALSNVKGWRVDYAGPIPQPVE